jgi:hypothetical protein
MDRVAVEYPDRYLGIAAHLIPKEVTATIEAGFLFIVSRSSAWAKMKSFSPTAKPMKGA